MRVRHRHAQPGNLQRAALVHGDAFRNPLSPQPVAQLENADNRRAALARAGDQVSM